MADKRRRRYVPIDVHLAFGKFGSALVAKWGMEGIGAWTLFLAACKREHQQGVFVYTTEATAWEKLGAEPAGFTLDEFFKFTGRHKKTSRRSHGRLTYVTCRVWNDWNITQRGSTDDPKTAHTPSTDRSDTVQTPFTDDQQSNNRRSAGAENPRKTRKTSGEKRDGYEPITAPEVEVEFEGEAESSSSSDAPARLALDDVLESIHVTDERLREQAHLEPTKAIACAMVAKQYATTNPAGYFRRLFTSSGMPHLAVVDDKPTGHEVVARLIANGVIQDYVDLDAELRERDLTAAQIDDLQSMLNDARETA